MPWTWGIHTTNIYSFKFLEPSIQNEVLSGSRSFWRLKGKLSPEVSAFWWLQGSLPCGNITLISASSFTWLFSLSSSLKRVFFSLWWAHLSLRWSHFEIINLILSAKSFFQIRSCTGSRVCIFWWGSPFSLLNLFNCSIFFTFKRELPKFFISYLFLHPDSN